GSAPNNSITVSDAVIQIEIDGVSAGGTANGLVADSSNVTIRGVSIVGFAKNGVGAASGDNFVLEGSFIGLRADGVTAAGNAFGGISVVTGTNARIGGPLPAQRNVISSNSSASGVGGIRMTSSTVTNAHIDGNLIGTDKSGTLDRGNGFPAGIFLQVI